jgi:hypothetical protein
MPNRSAIDVSLVFKKKESNENDYQKSDNSLLFIDDRDFVTIKFYILVILSWETILFRYRRNPNSHRWFTLSKNIFSSICVYLTFSEYEDSSLSFSVDVFMYIDHPQFERPKSQPNLLCSLLIGIDRIYICISFSVE